MTPKQQTDLMQQMKADASFSLTYFRHLVRPKISKCSHTKLGTKRFSKKKDRNTHGFIEAHWGLNVITAEGSNSLTGAH